MIVLGLDPATTTGFALADSTRGRDPHQCIVAHGERTFRAATRGKTIDQFYIWLLSTVEHYRTDLTRVTIAYEEAAKGSRNLQAQRFHYHLESVILLIAERIGADTRCYNPLSLKKYATGSGRASKQDMQRAARLHSLGDLGDNEADACFVAMMAVQGIRSSELVRRKPKRSKILF